MIKAVLFDMDGLMFDTERLGQGIWLCTAPKFGIDITAEHLTLLRGTNLSGSRQIFAKLFGEKADFDGIRNAVHELMEIELDKAVPHRPGLVPLLEYLKKREMKMAVASSTNAETVKKYLKNADVANYFSAVIGGDMIERSKPAPDIYLKAAQKLCVEGEECIAFEDSLNGVRSAHAAHCHTIMVPDMDAPTIEISALCHAILPRLDSAIKYMEELNNEY